MLAIAQHSERDDDLDRGTTSVAPGTMRTCALTRELKPVADMIRFVVGPTGEVIADVKRKLPGRGLWITATRAGLEQAVKRNVFSRGFKREVKVARDFAVEVDRLLERSALDAWQSRPRRGRWSPGSPKSRRRSAGTTSRRWSTRPTGQRTESASWIPPYSAIRPKSRVKSQQSRHFPAPNWIWH